MTSQETSLKIKQFRLLSSNTGLLLIAFCQCVFVLSFTHWPILFNGQTLSTEATTPGIMPNCRTTGSELKCQEGLASPISYDPIAISSQEIPIDYLRAFSSKQGESVLWNPYIGSGYPNEFDQMNGRYSLFKWILSTWPGDGGRDINHWVRLFLMILPLGWLAILVSQSAFVSLAVLFITSLAPHLNGRLDNVMFDADVGYGWYLLLLYWALKKENQSLRLLTGAFLLGAFEASVGFLQSQFSFFLSAGLTSLALIRTKKSNLPQLKLGLAVTLGFFSLYPAWLPSLQALSDFYYRHKSSGCIAVTDHMGWIRFLQQAVLSHESSEWIMTGIGTVLILGMSWKEKFTKSLSIALAAISAVMVFHFPEIICKIPGISGIRFDRHLAPHCFTLLTLIATLTSYNLLNLNLNSPRGLSNLRNPNKKKTSLFLFFIALASIPVFYELRHWQQFQRFYGFLLLATLMSVILLFKNLQRQSIATPILFRSLILLLPVLAVYPPIVSTEYFRRWITHNFPTHLPPHPEKLDPAFPFGALQTLSQNEDRRHYSPQELLYPNWSSAFRILDLRVLSALYPQYYYKLNSSQGLVDFWIRDFTHEINPDRFVRSNLPESSTLPLFQKLLILNRVSLLSFVKGHPLLSDDNGPYSKNNCQLRSSSDQIELYRCPRIGGVGFFPKQVKAFENDEEMISYFKHSPTPDLIDFAGILKADILNSPPIQIPAQGKIVQFYRKLNEMTYVLEVTQPGLFVFADTWFKGWSVTVNSQTAPLSRVNIAFKGVPVLIGKNIVHFKFGSL